MTTTQPASNGGGSGPGALLPIAIAMLVVGLLGTLLYQRQSETRRPAVARRPLDQGPAPSSS